MFSLAVRLTDDCLEQIEGPGGCQCRVSVPCASLSPFLADLIMGGKCAVSGF